MMACSAPPVYWSTGAHCFTCAGSQGRVSSSGLRNRRKYQEESKKVSIVSVSRRASPPHEGQAT